MSKDSIADWSVTPASNADIGGTDITGTTGLVKNGDNALRAIMAQVKAGVNSGYTTTATAAGTTVLTANSNTYQYFTGSTTQTITMPVTSTLVLGWQIVFINQSTGTLTINSSGGNLIAVVPGQSSATIQCILVTGTTAASWAVAPPASLFVSNDAGASDGPFIELYRNSPSPAVNDQLGRVDIRGNDNTLARTLYAFISTRIDAVKNGGAGAVSMILSAMSAGTVFPYLYLGSNAAGTATAGAAGLPGGQLSFPATQNASSDANTLDDYEEGTWTPVLSFATPGNLTVAYTTQLGQYQKVGKLVTLWFSIITSTFTHTTASGNLQITGVPFTPDGTLETEGKLSWAGITKATYTEIGCSLTTNTTMLFRASGSGVARSIVAFGDTPTGGTVVLNGCISYMASA